MPTGTGANTRAAYIAEATFGTTPATPTFKMMRVTRAGMRNMKTTAQSVERSPDRNVRDEPITGQDGGGTYDGEMPYGSHDDFIEAVMCGTWTTNVLVNGLVRRSFTIEETVELGATDSYQRYPGAEVNSWNLDIVARQPVTGSFDIMALKKDLATAAIAGATYTAPNANEMMTASASVASLDVNGLSPEPFVRRVQISVSNNFRRRPIVGDLHSIEYGEGMLDVTGTIEAYFSSNVLYQAVIDHGIGNLTFTLGHQANKKYTFSMPKIRFLDGAAQTGGAGDDIMLNVPFRAIYDSGIAGSLQITRAVA